jgi:hypothetical protein
LAVPHSSFTPLAAIFSADAGFDRAQRPVVLFQLSRAEAMASKS